MKEKDNVDKIIIEFKPVKCALCSDKLFYIGGGKYKCQSCDHIEYDDFGKVKAYLDENGPRPALEVSEATGVSMAILDVYLKNGRVEIPEGSKLYLDCEKCGCSIRYGRYCPECARALAGNMHKVFLENVGEKPKRTAALSGKIHYIGKDKK